MEFILDDCVLFPPSIPSITFPLFNDIYGTLMLNNIVSLLCCS